MKFLIWFGSIFVVTLLNGVIGAATGFMFGPLITYPVAIFASIKFCRMYDVHRAKEQETINYNRLKHVLPDINWGISNFPPVEEARGITIAGYMPLTVAAVDSGALPVGRVVTAQQTLSAGLDEQLYIDAAETDAPEYIDAPEYAPEEPESEEPVYEEAEFPESRGDDGMAGPGVCTVCGAKLFDDADFCVKCGSKVERALFCMKCGAKIVDGADFCIKCGSKVYRGTDI